MLQSCYNFPKNPAKEGEKGKGVLNPPKKPTPQNPLSFCEKNHGGGKKGGHSIGGVKKGMRSQEPLQINIGERRSPFSHFYGGV